MTIRGTKSFHVSQYSPTHTCLPSESLIDQCATSIITTFAIATKSKSGGNYTVTKQSTVFVHRDVFSNTFLYPGTSWSQRSYRE